MNKETIERYLSEMTDYFKENDEVALATYYHTFYASELVDELWNVIVDKCDANYYGY